MRDFVKVTRALSDETRLRILNLLLERECCVCEVMQALDISQTRASRNLNILYDAGFLTLRKEGLWSLYSIKKLDESTYFPEIIEAIKKGLKGNMVVVEDRQRLKNVERVGQTCAEQRIRH